MAHVFHGNWSSFLVDTDGRKLEDGRLHLVVSDAGEVSRDSRHDQDFLAEGNTKHGDFRRIELLFEQSGLYRGVLVVDTPAFQMICGWLDLNPDGEPVARVSRREGSGDDEAGAADARRASQDEIIWVATKP